MDGQRLYEERVLELVRQNVTRSAKPVTVKIDAHYFAGFAPVIHLQKSGKQGRGVHLGNGEDLVCKDNPRITKIIWADDVEKLLGHILK